VRHDLRGAVSPIRMAVQLLRLGQVDAAEREEALGVIERQLGQLLEGIDDLGDWLRVQAGAYEHAPVLQDANLLLDLACGRGGLLRQLDLLKLRVRCEPHAEEIVVEHDPARLATLIEFLLLRVAAHAQPGSELVLGLTRDGEGIELHLAGARDSLANDDELRFLRGDPSANTEPSLRALLMRETMRLAGLQLRFPAADRLALRLASPPA
jgi:signal transduction histidine kinase